MIASLLDSGFGRAQSMQWLPGELPAGGCISLGELFRLNAPISSGLRVTACLQEERCWVLIRLVLLRNGQPFTVILAPTSGIWLKKSLPSAQLFSHLIVRHYFWVLFALVNCKWTECFLSQENYFRLVIDLRNILFLHEAWNKDTHDNCIWSALFNTANMHPRIWVQFAWICWSMVLNTCRQDLTLVAVWVMQATRWR